MDKKHSEEVTTRRRAILFWMQGKRPCEIFRRMGRSRKWFYKWLRRFKEHAWEGLDDAPRRPTPGHKVIRIRHGTWCCSFAGAPSGGELG
jgi:transposase